MKWCGGGGGGSWGGGIYWCIGLSMTLAESVSGGESCQVDFVDPIRVR